MSSICLNSQLLKVETKPEFLSQNIRLGQSQGVLSDDMASHVGLGNKFGKRTGKQSQGKK